MKQKKPKKLTGAQELILSFANAAKENPNWHGICPRRGQHGVFRLLAAEGLLREVGWGVDDHDHSHDVLLYVITKAGQKALKALTR
jgi:hypothetical protein